MNAIFALLSPSIYYHFRTCFPASVQVTALDHGFSKKIIHSFIYLTYFTTFARSNGTCIVHGQNERFILNVMESR